MIYSLLVLSSPASGHTTLTAAAFARAVLERGHSIHRVFFLDEGTYAGAAGSVFPQDEPERLSPWITLAQEYQLDLVLCISSALRRGMMDETEAQRYDKAAATVHPVFAISGMGQLVDASAHSDRLITFGGQ